MKIGELSELTGLPASRIRFYERIGLLKLVKRNSNGYRSYPVEAASVLVMIARAQKVGFSLDELRVLVPSDMAQWDSNALIASIRGKLEEIEVLQRNLEENKAQMLSILASIETRPDNVNCEDNAKQIMSRFGLGIPLPVLTPGESE